MINTCNLCAHIQIRVANLAIRWSHEACYLREKLTKFATSCVRLPSLIAGYMFENIYCNSHRKKKTLFIICFSIPHMTFPTQNSNRPEGDIFYLSPCDNFDHHMRRIRCAYGSVLQGSWRQMLNQKL